MKTPFSRVIAALAVVAVCSPLALPMPVRAAEPGAAEALRELQQSLDEYRDASELYDVQASGADAAEAPEIRASADGDEYLRGEIVSLDDEQTVDLGGVQNVFRIYSVRLLDGSASGSVVQLEDNDLDGARKGEPLRPGDRIALVRATDTEGNPVYHVADRYRLPQLAYIALLFFLVAAIVGGKRGLSALLGLVFTVIVIAGWAVPRILTGGAAFPTLLIAAIAIATVSIFLAHGANAASALAVGATLATLALTVAIELVFAAKAHLVGLGSEEAFFLAGAGVGDIDLRGLLLGGILLGALGVLDDVTTAQVAVVGQLKAANPAFNASDLYARGLLVGREHIASLVNTLFLAYAGASLPLFLLYATGQGTPLWFMVNSEMLAEEIVRAVIGSLCLVLAVPITTLIAARWYGNRTPPVEPSAHAH